MIARRTKVAAVLGLILAVALGWRLINLGFGLPSMLDPDEPFFMLTALQMLKEGTANPGWFGHPGSTTLYLLVVIDLLVVLFGLVTGQFATLAQFAAAAYANPALLFIPARLTMVLFGVACVWLTFLVSRRQFGATTALLAAALLAINPLHIEWSQVIRTDVMAAVFMLGCLLFANRIAEYGRLRDYLIAGLFVGLSAATKWPAVTVAVAIVGAFIFRWIADPVARKRQVAWLGAAGLSSIVGLFLAAPYVFLDWQTVLANVGGEARTAHLGHTGHGFVSNLTWYLGVQGGGSMGWAGIALALVGIGVTLTRKGPARWTLVPAAAALLILISAQSMIWSRWFIPVLPLLCIFASVAIVALAEVAQRLLATRHKALLTALIASAALLPALAGAFAGSRERANETRLQAAQWARDNIPAGKTVALEHLALALRTQPWKILFPIGEAGCLDALKIIDSQVRYQDVQSHRKGSAIVDLGNVSRARVATCRADYFILTYYDLYVSERDQFPKEVETYRQLLAGGRTVALFEPRKGVATGPVVRIVEIPSQRPRGTPAER